jgi:hypothetical protein
MKRKSELRADLTTIYASSRGVATVVAFIE